MMETIAANFPSTGGREKKKISTGRVVVLVIAAAAPLAALVGNTPLGLAQPAGLSMPIAYLLVGLTLLAFAAGYTALSREIVSQGAFYTQVGQGLGRPAGLVAAYCAGFAYAVYSVGMAAAFGYFTSLLFHEMGIEVSWLALAAGGMALVAFLGYRSLDLSARLLVFFLVAEFAILLAFDICVIASKGLAAFPLDVWSVANLTNPGIGAVFPFVVVSFIGFEAAALYGEETHQPRRSIPRATFIALGVIMVFYTLSVLGHHRRGGFWRSASPRHEGKRQLRLRAGEDLWWRRPCRCDGHLPRSLVPRELSRHSQRSEPLSLRTCQ